MAISYTIKEAIEELDTIRMETRRHQYTTSNLIGELASVTGWIVRHMEITEKVDADNLLSLALQDMVDRFAPNDDGLSDAEIACAQRAREVLELSRIRKVRKK